MCCYVVFTLEMIDVFESEGAVPTFGIYDTSAIDRGGIVYVRSVCKSDLVRNGE